MKHFYIGDIHGYAKHLEILLKEIERLNGADATINFIGDLVDRGPDSKNVLDLVISAQEQWENCYFHLGNHDQKFKNMIKQGNKSSDFHDFIKYGGAETLHSYQVDENNVQTIAALYPTHLKLLEDAILYRKQGSFTSAHAGIDFLTPLEKQTESTLCWIREPFLNHIDAVAPVVIHGHTIVGAKPVITENRISIDTGIYKSGLLTCCIIESPKNIQFFKQTDKRLRPLNLF